MRTTKDVLEFLNEQIIYVESEFKDKGLNPPLLAKRKKGLDIVRLEEKYWLCQTLKWFINEEI